MKSLENLVGAMTAGNAGRVHGRHMRIPGRTYRISCVCTGVSFKESCLSLGSGGSPNSSSCLAVGEK